MLSHLSIQNMAIIESLELDLNKNMTVLTGETGAGKSIIIDAISLLIGDRASTDFIRHHEEMAVIEGVFEIEHNEPLKAYLFEQNIPVDNQLLIKRTIKRVGSGQIRVNGELLTANQLKEIGQYLVDIHVQHDTHRLFHHEYNYQLIDNFDLTKGLKLSTLVYACVNNEFNKYLKFMKREKRDTSNDISLQEAIYKNKNDEELTLEKRIGDSSIVIEDDILDSIRDETLKQVLSYLTKEEQKILLLHYGLVDGICYSFAEIGEKFNLSSERIRQKEMLALKRLRHPRITKKIKDFW